MIDFGIIAAGDGNRIKQEGSKVAKPLLEVSGTPMIGRLISIMEQCKADSVSIIVNSDMPDVWDYLNSYVPQSGCRLKLLQAKTPSSMHTFYELMNLMNPSGRFVVTTVDTIFRELEFKRYVESFVNCPDDVDGEMGVTSFIDDEKPLYVATDDTGRITGYHDSPFPGVKYVSAGIYGLRPNAVPVLETCIKEGVERMRNFQRRLIEAGLNLRAFDLGKVLDVDHLDDLRKANEFLV